MTSEDASVPAVVLKLTGTPERPLPLVSTTLAVSVLVPPVAGTTAGLALRLILATAAEPIAIFTTFAAVLVVVPPVVVDVLPPPAPPEMAVMVAVPDEVPAINVTATRPPVSVVASNG